MSDPQDETYANDRPAARPTPSMLQQWLEWLRTGRPKCVRSGVSGDFKATGRREFRSVERSKPLGRRSTEPKVSGSNPDGRV